MPYYTEPVRREPNAKGKLRLVSVLAELPGAVGQGFDGDGTPPQRGRNEEAGRRRVFWFDTALTPPFPSGVAPLPDAAYNALNNTREATKPLPSPTVPQRIQVDGGIIRATYFERLDSGTAGTVIPPNSARIVLDQWDEEIDAVVSADDSGIPSLESPTSTGGQTVTVTLDISGNWSLSARPTSYPVHLIYVAETEVGNYVDSTKLISE